MIRSATRKVASGVRSRSLNPVPPVVKIKSQVLDHSCNSSTIDFLHLVKWFVWLPGRAQVTVHESRAPIGRQQVLESNDHLMLQCQL